MKKVYGLVVCGGMSSRMGVDKSMLVYHGIPQRYHLYDMLTELSDTVFISCNPDQEPEIPENFERIVDAPEYAGIGPMASLLSSFKKYPNADFLVCGCDYPFLKIEDLIQLLTEAKDVSKACAFYNPLEKIFEPLLAYYKPGCYSEIFTLFAKSDYSLRHLLNDIQAKKVLPKNLETLKSVDTQDGYLDAMEKLRNT